MDFLSCLPAVLGSSAVVAFAKPLARALAEKIGLLMLPTQEAQQLLIEQIKASNDPDPVKLLKIKHANKILREMENQYDIYALAQQELNADPENDHSKDVDGEWLSRFMDACKHVSTADMQFIWARLLSSECKNPGTCPARLIQILSTLDHSLATTFANICGMSLQEIVLRDGKISFTSNYIPLVKYEKRSDFLKTYGITFAALTELDSIGLIQFDSVLNFVLEATVIDVLCGNDIYHIQSAKSDISVGDVIYTEAGKSLFKIVATPEIPHFKEYFLSFFVNCTVERTGSISIQSESNKPPPAVTQKSSS